MAAILDLSSISPMAGVQLCSREKNQTYMALAILGPNFVFLGRLEQFVGKYGLSPLTIHVFCDFFMVGFVAGVI